MSESGGYQKMPPGWDCKYDQATGNCYYINYLTKAMQLEDPRGRSYRQLQNERCSTESIALQQLVSQPQTSHNSSPYHVHPSNNLTAIRAFQERQQPTLHNISTSPLLSASSRGHLEMSSPLPFQRARVGPNLSRRSTIQETSFTTQAETDAVVTKIQNMFPTAGENHIRLLLKRYMKNIFPKADEELLLDILANADNNVQFASEKLISLGYTKRDMQQPHRPNNRPPDLNQDQEAGGDQSGVHIPLRPKEYTEEEKTKMQTLLKEKYPQIAERIILMALESVNYAEDRATQILQIVQDEDEQREQKQAPMNPKHLDLKKTTGTEQIDGANEKDRHRQHSLGNSHNSESAEFQSIIERMASLGPNSQLSKGADENLLLADYVTWNGPNTKLLQKQITQGPNASLLTDRTYKPRGGKSELCKGPQSGLAKGSIYAQGSNKSANIKCN
uniref:Uncharacterized protein, isoform L n=1 Tax=Drosophila melanogaster TaxID=7227 RepID=Q9VP66_DROME|nr:uncharacterized protein Dmel_CG10508, isoform L [Drosophila melanogaster]AAF51689.5 uncharacterized protein Dmel_CG10508, isoform L [Drosophila melanogaster]|eukprot:NP_788560.3 uncharacterized protein Dmel_CG10508, isoform L [Drosophila melanogaster]